MPGVRKRTFDDQDALRTAMELFWCQGYEGTSIADLTQALGINPPSLYAAFGSKRDLFERTLNRYMCERTIQLEEAMTRPTADEAVLELLTGRVEVFTSPCQPAGCMTIPGGAIRRRPTPGNCRSAGGCPRGDAPLGATALR